MGDGRRIVTVDVLEIFREGCFGPPFPITGNGGIACPYCGERTKRDPCVNCGYPITLEYVKGRD
jgi:uncharacterized Zn-finger protein